MCTIRPATLDDAETIAAVHVAAWRTAYRGLIDDATLDGLSVAARLAMWEELLADPPADRFLLIAESDRRGTVGFIDAGRLPAGDDVAFDAELFAIYLLAEFRGRGIGTRLVRKAVEKLQSLGCRSLRLDVLRDSPFRRFYDKLGGTVVRQQPYELHGQTLAKLTYGWRDLDAIPFAD